jgi:alkanesulfonate monooxygenase SsuD/methylene tetrahydromethanopterin reductase-like flavin-dependent oxidoreductase (luciferase family)
VPVQLATLDRLGGGGRLAVGLGSGWSRDELEAAGGSLAERGRRLDETLDVLAAVWGPDPVEYRGRYAAIAPAAVAPEPAGRIPVLLAEGAGESALDRIARRADGWLCAGHPAQQAAATWNRIRARAAELGRDTTGLEFHHRATVILTDEPVDGDRFPFVGSVEQVVDDAVRSSDVGVGELLLDLQLQGDLLGGGAMLETAVEIRDRVVALAA